MPRSVVTPLGLEWDRQLAIVDVATGRALTARRERRLLMLSAAVVDGNVRIGTPDGVPLTSDEDLSGWLDRPVRLARPPNDRQPDYEYPVDPEDESGLWSVWTGPAGVWHDDSQTQVSIMSTTSLRDWPVRRFRPNVLLSDADENALVGRRVAIGSVVLDVTKRIDRCVMVNRAQPGIEQEQSVLRTVLRECDGFLGVGALVAEPGRVQVGDELRDVGPSPRTTPPPPPSPSPIP